MTLTAMDIFAGGGGLSEGMRQAGFDIRAAVEKEPSPALTYRINHPTSVVLERDLRHVSGTELLSVAGLSSGELDLLAACPPCQGFSSLTTKYRRDDDRNSLIAELARIVAVVMPKAIMVENVPGLAVKGKRYLDEFVHSINALGYIASYAVLQVADYGVPQKRRRFVLLAGLGRKIEIPKPTHSETGIDGLTPWVTVRETISDLGNPVPFEYAQTYGGAQAVNWHVTRTLSPLNRERLNHVTPGGMRFDLPDHLRPPCHKGLNTGFSNVYGRMSWDSPSPTITGGCVTFSKGRFGHPDQIRTISVREAARLQTFPDSFDLGPVSLEQACQIVGNALPCEFARIMSRACFN